MQNPLPKPETISRDVNNIVKNLIRTEFQKKGSLDFFDTMKFLEQCIVDQDIKRAYITAYYCVNMILSSSKTDQEKTELISGICRSLPELESKQESKDDLDDLE